jgi:hypothetical protein
MNRANTVMDAFNREPADNRRTHENRLVRREKIRKAVVQFLKEHPCIDCGETDVLVLEFDHITGTKRSNVGVLITRGKSEKRVLAEIAKCCVRCANCHRRKTGQTLWRLSFI